MTKAAKPSNKVTRPVQSGRFIGKTVDGIRVMRPHLPPKNVDLDKLRNAIREIKEQQSA